jgi:hypothetical protein
MVVERGADASGKQGVFGHLHFAKIRIPYGRSGFHHRPHSLWDILLPK